jgi:transcriptional regulator with XRE-family HTH domain
MKLGQIVQITCKERGWTVARLARESGVPAQTIHNWSLAKGAINPDQVKKISQVLGVSLHYLLYGEGDPHEAPFDEVLKEIFSGDVRVTLHRVERKRGRT